MLRNFLSKSAFDSLASSGYNISNNPVCVQSVRWRRKPRWLPMAKSKLFKVPVRPILPEAEVKEWQRLNNNYRTQMSSVRGFLRDEVQAKKIQKAEAMTPADEEAEFQRCSAINEEWNFECSKIRDARVTQENADRREYIQKAVELNKARRHGHMQVIEERVRKQKEAVATFITSKNIDEAIEHALANPTDYNFSIDLEGNIHKGAGKKDTKPES